MVEAFGGDIVILTYPRVWEKITISHLFFSSETSIKAEFRRESLGVHVFDDAGYIIQHILVQLSGRLNEEVS